MRKTPTSHIAHPPSQPWSPPIQHTAFEHQKHLSAGNQTKYNACCLAAVAPYQTPEIKKKNIKKNINFRQPSLVRSLHTINNTARSQT